jgi:hypothetical protein
MEDYEVQAFTLLELAMKISGKYNCGSTEALNVVIASRHKDDEAIHAYAALYFSAKKMEEQASRPYTASEINAKAQSVWSNSLLKDFASKTGMNIHKSIEDDMLDAMSMVNQPLIKGKK